jgi:FkbM family methyltransferase
MALNQVSQRGFKDTLIDATVRMARHLPRGRTSLFRFAHQLVGSPKRLIGTVDQQWFCVDVSDEGIALQIYLWDRWEPDVTDLILALLGPGRTFVDVGANKGYFSLLAAKSVLPNGRVVSYEPHPANADDIEITIAENDHLHWVNRRFAASSEHGTIRLYTPGWDAGMSGWASIHRPCDSFIDVNTAKLSTDLKELKIETVDLMKIDVEGHEVEVVKGVSELLAEGRVSNLLIEVHLMELQPTGIDQLFQQLRCYNYHSYLLTNSIRGNSKHHSENALQNLRPVTCN